MKAWNHRPVEIRNLFNPAFCGLLLHRAISGHGDLSPDGMPFSLTFLVLPLCLHKETRETLAEGNRSQLLRVIEMNQEVLVHFPKRASDLVPYTLEALGMLLERQCIEITDAGSLRAVPNTVRKSVTGTTESVSCQRVSRFIGKEFARIDDRVTVYTTLGVRP